MTLLNKLCVFGFALLATASFASATLHCEGDGAQVRLELTKTDGDNVTVQYHGQTFTFAAKINQFVDPSHTRLAGLLHIQADLPRRQYISLLEGAGFSGTAALDLPDYTELTLSCGAIQIHQPICPRCSVGGP